MKLSEIKTLIKEELANQLEKDRRVYLRGISNMVKNNPSIQLQDIIDSTLKEKGVSSIEELSYRDAMNLNIALAKVVVGSKPPLSSSPSTLNPRDFGGGPSTHPLRKGYTGD